MNSELITLNQALRRQAEKTPEKIFILNKRGSLTYGQTQDLVDRVASAFGDHGIKSGDRICMILPRVPELIVSFLAATNIGALPAPVNYLLKPKEVISFLKRLAPSAIIAQANLIFKELEDFATTAADPLLLVDIAGCAVGWSSWRDMCRVAGKKSDYVAGADDLAYLNFTTGSSGLPKGALATHANIYWNTRSAIEALDITADDTHLCMFASFAHPHELFSRALYVGGTLVLLEEINPKTIIKTINEYSISCMMGLAPMYEMMANHSRPRTLQQLRVIESGGMFTRKDVNEHFHRQFGLPILSVWGSTETTGIAIANTLQEYKCNGSMGKACPYYQVKIIDEDGREVDNETIGELVFQGPGVVAGYDGNNTLELIDGWYRSGDLAYQDRDGYYYFVERKNGMIKVAGLKVYPLQLELILIEHPDIDEVAVLGVTDRRKGNVPKAFFSTKDGKRLNLDDIQSFCKSKVPSYMLPKQIEQLTSLPKIGSGKIDKKMLASPN